MWSPDVLLIRPMLRVELSAHTLTITRSSRLGRQGQVEHLPVAADVQEGREPWRAAVDALAQWLASHKKSRFQVQLLLSGRWVRWQLLPWRAELSGASERAAYAALRFRETFGSSAQHWHVLPAHLPPGQTAPAAAVDAALITALQTVCQEAGSQLHSITPYFSSSFDRWRTQLKGALVWFGTLESDTVTLSLLKDGQWTALQTQRLPANEPDIGQTALRNLQAHVALACGAATEGVPLYLASGGQGAVAAPSLRLVTGH